VPRLFTQELAGLTDKDFVQAASDSLTRQAQQLLEAAEAAQSNGQQVSAFTLLIEGDGGIRVLMDCDWPLESLLRHHGARAVYRVVETSGRIQVEGRTGQRTCLLQSISPQAAARFLFATRASQTLPLSA
jgi:hypothetical protein